MKFILAKKLGMTRKFLEDGTAVPVTYVQAGPSVVTDVKTAKRNGYGSVQIGFGSKKKISKPLKGQLQNLGNFRYIKEFRVAEPEKLKKGDVISASVFNVGDRVQVEGVSKGKGFQGVVKRHHFAGSPATHGHKDQLRMPGSIGSGYPEHVRKGKRMAGRMGGGQVTVINLKIAEVTKGSDKMAISGAIPGPINSLVLISGAGEMDLNIDKAQTEQKEAEDKKETK